MDALLRDKIKIRSEIINLCSTLSPIYKQNAIAMLSEHLQELISTANKICIYRARDWEPSLDLVILKSMQQSKQLYQPRAVLDNKSMLCERYHEHKNRLFVKTDGLDDLENLIQWHELDIILIPLVAVDKLRGTRLGRGGGYYDTSLNAVKKKNPNIIFCGVGYNCQIVAHVPQEKHDVCLDFFVSESGLINFNRKYSATK
jgi:5-formyltetrahydrofolate cyclo-ligase